MKTRQLLGYIIAFLLIFASAYSALGLTASIGNARMILYPNMEEGKPAIIDKTILVKNVNDIPLKIALTPMGALDNQTEIIDTGFILQPNESKDARFRITVPAPGTYETQIGVTFFTVNSTKEDGVGLASNIIIIAKINQTQPTNNWVNHTIVPTNPVKSALSLPLLIGGLVLLILLIAAISLVIIRQSKKGEKDGKTAGKKRK